jgi:hypothetical protein
MPLLTELVAICVAIAIEISLLRSCFSDGRPASAESRRASDGQEWTEWTGVDGVDRSGP